MTTKVFNNIFKFTTGFLLGLLLFACMLAYPKDLGVIGQVYKIKEMDLVEFIESRLRKMEKRGELAKIRQGMVNTTKARVERPEPVKGLSAAKSSRSWLIDPSVKADNDIRDSEGKLIIKAGTKVNPLQQRSFSRTLIFYDGDNKEQVAWVKKQNGINNNKNKLILVSGSIPKQIKLFNKRIYFDQQGRLVSKFKIKHTPAVVTQEGLHFKVEEVAL